MKIYDWRKFASFIITVVCVVLLIALTILAVQMVKEERELDHTESYTIQSGETLWEIGTRYRPETMSIQEYIFNLQEFNHIGSIIYPEQEIQILIYKEV